MTEGEKCQEAQWSDEEKAAQGKNDRGGAAESELHGSLMPTGSAQNSAGPPWAPCSPSISAGPGSRRRLHLNLLRLDVRTDRSPGQ